ncbi:acyl-CoA thioesterase [Nakamurella alba]|uniref:acyl-CoA thioesterase n=1 Tax=Nakamurella alba TaxID=2665158 RepID=UPI002AC31F84|nr:acyl-CoA thioesterase [Nakamurella alba]
MLAQFPVRQLHRTRWADNDSYGHLNNTVHNQLFDTAVNTWLLETCGAELRAADSIGIVAETSVHFLAEAAYPADVTVAVGVEHRGRSSVVYRVAIFTGAGTPDEIACSVGRFVHVYVDRDTRRPVPMPAAVAAAADGIRLA